MTAARTRRDSNVTGMPLCCDMAAMSQQIHVCSAHSGRSRTDPPMTGTSPSPGAEGTALQPHPPPPPPSHRPGCPCSAGAGRQETHAPGASGLPRDPLLPRSRSLKDLIIDFLEHCGRNDGGKLRPAGRLPAPPIPPAAAVAQLGAGPGASLPPSRPGGASAQRRGGPAPPPPSARPGGRRGCGGAPGPEVPARRRLGPAFPAPGGPERGGGWGGGGRRQVGPARGAAARPLAPRGRAARRTREDDAAPPPRPARPRGRSHDRAGGCPGPAARPPRGPRRRRRVHS